MDALEKEATIDATNRDRGWDRAGLARRLNVRDLRTGARHRRDDGSQQGGLVVFTALRSEYVAVLGALGGVPVYRCGMGPERAARSATAVLSTRRPAALAVAGVAGGLDPALRAGDVVVATEARDEHGSTVLRGAAPLVAELRAMGLRVHSGPIVSRSEVVSGPERARLAATGALAVDMESAAVARAAAASPGRPPVAVVRVIVDTAHVGVRRPETIPNGARSLITLRRAVRALPRWAELVGPRRILLAAPRSFCAGVERAIDIVEQALRRYPHPVYVRRQIVHNVHVVDDLRRRGAVFVDELDEVPDGTTVVFSAHGVAPSVRAEAGRRELTVVDATCPLVTKVHSEAKRFSARGDTVLFVGHAHHDETEGTLGQVPGNIRLVETAEQAETLTDVDGEHVALLTQTTLAVEDAAAVSDVLRRRFPGIQQPATEDICYATTNRQNAVRAVTADSDVVLVLGSVNSSNSRRLVEVAERGGTRAHLVDDATAIRAEWLRGARTVGITAGASAPPYLVDEVVRTLRALGPVTIEEREVTTEDLRFALPRGVAD